MVGELINTLIALDILKMMSMYFSMKEQDSVYGWYLTNVEWRF